MVFEYKWNIYVALVLETAELNAVISEHEK
jgi:hypothetical protein